MFGTVRKRLALTMFWQDSSVLSIYPKTMFGIKSPYKNFASAQTARSPVLLQPRQGYNESLACASIISYYRGVAIAKAKARQTR